MSPLLNLHDPPVVSVECTPTVLPEHVLRYTLVSGLLSRPRWISPSTRLLCSSGLWTPFSLGLSPCDSSSHTDLVSLVALPYVARASPLFSSSAPETMGIPLELNKTESTRQEPLRTRFSTVLDRMKLSVGPRPQLLSDTSPFPSTFLWSVLRGPDRVLVVDRPPHSTLLQHPTTHRKPPQTFTLRGTSVDPS